MMKEVVFYNKGELTPEGLVLVKKAKADKKRRELIRDYRAFKKAGVVFDLQEYLKKYSKKNK